MERVYVLVDVEREKLDAAIIVLSQIPGVVKVDPVTGEHDLVVIVDGVKATETLVVINQPR